MRIKEEFEKSGQFSLDREEMFRKGFIEGAKYVFDEVDKGFNEYGILKFREFEQVENQTVINIKNKLIGVFHGRKEKGEKEDMPNLWSSVDVNSSGTKSLLSGEEKGKHEAQDKGEG